MLFIKGTRRARIKTYTAHSHACRECGTFDLKVRVYNDYYHFFFIPIAPIGVKSVVMHCNQCGGPNRYDSLAREYENKTRNPFYLYTLMILFGLLIAMGIAASIFGGQERSAVLADPRPGDVFEVKKEGEDAYYFLRLVTVGEDSVVALHNHMEYSNIVHEFSNEDHFITADSIVFRKIRLKELYDTGKIVFISRDYSDEAGFRRAE